MEGEEEEKTDPDEESKKKVSIKREAKLKMRHERERLLLKTAAVAGLAAGEHRSASLPFCDIADPLVLPFESTSRAEERRCDSRQHVTRLNSLKMT